MTVSERTSGNKLDIRKFPKGDGSNWIDVLLKKWTRPGERVPSFIPTLCDLHRIIQAIAECEDEKYPPPAKGRTKLAEFLYDAAREPDWATLARKYNIPERDETGRVIATNGADLRRVTPTPRLNFNEVP